MSLRQSSARVSGQHVLCALPGALAGLFAARLVAESWPHAWRWWQLAPLAALLFVGGGVGSLLLSRRWQVWPLGLSVVYLLWPLPQLWPAVWVALSMIVAFVLANSIAARHTAWHEGVITLVALALYLATLAPGLLPADAGEFQIVASTLGIAHPPGYPLYTLLGRLLVLLPISSPAWRLNLFAALCAAGCVGVVARAVGRHTGSGWLAVLAGAALMVTPTFWVQGVGTNIRSLTALLVALGAAQALRWERSRATRDLTLLGLVLGLGVGHHASVALLLPAYLALVLLSEPRIVLRPRRWLGAVGAALASLIVIAYLPLRSAMNPAFAPSPVRSWGDLVAHVLALGFGGDMLRYTSWADLCRRAGALAQILRLEHGPAVLAMAALAMAGLLWRQWRLAVLVGGIWLLNVLSAITYRAPQTVEYIMPSYVAVALLLGLGLQPVLGKDLPRNALLTAAAVAVVWLGASSWPSMRALHHDDGTRAQAEILLHAAPADALILAGWHQATPLWYLTLVEGERPDVTVTYVYPEGATPNAEVWLRRVREVLPARPVVVTNRFHAYDAADLWFEPLGAGWLVRSAPGTSDAADGANFGEVLRLAGWRLEANDAAPGGTLQLDLTLAATAPPGQDYTLFAQLLGPEGVVAQDDRLVRTSRLRADEELHERLQPTVLLDCAPGSYQLIIGLYTCRDGALQRLPTATGESLVLTTVQVHPLRHPTVTAHPVEWRWSNGLRLLGLDVDRSVAGQQRLYAHVHAATGQSAPATLVVTGTDGAALAQASLAALPEGGYALVSLDLPEGVREARLALAQAEAPVHLLAPWHRQARDAIGLDLAAYGQRYVPLGGEMALTGWSGACEGSSCQLTAELLALRPLTADYSVSLGVRGAAGEAKSDGTPVTGAIPTLKWLAGWRPQDTRTVRALDGEADAGVLTVYDAFTLRTLQVLDDRLVRAGQGTELLLPLP